MKTIEDIKYLMVGKGLITDLADLLRANDEEFAESEKNMFDPIFTSQQNKFLIVREYRYGGNKTSGLGTGFHFPSYGFKSK